MPKVRLLVPLTDNSGKPHAAGEVVSVDDETAAEWRASGKASLISDEEKAQPPGVYNARTGRDDAEPLDPTADQGGPQSADPPPKKKK